MTEQLIQKRNIQIKVGVFEQRTCRGENCNAVLKQGNKSGYCSLCHARPGRPIPDTIPKTLQVKDGKIVRTGGKRYFLLE